MVPCRENTKLWQSTLESDKSELKITQMIPTQFFSEITYDKTWMNSGIFQPEIMLGCRITEMSYIMKQLENAIDIMMPLTF